MKFNKAPGKILRALLVMLLAGLATTFLVSVFVFLWTNDIDTRLLAAKILVSSSIAFLIVGSATLNTR